MPPRPFEGQRISNKQGGQALDTISRAAPQSIGETLETLGSPDHAMVTEQLKAASDTAQGPEAKHAFDVLAAMDGPDRETLAGSWGVEFVDQPPERPPR